MGRKQGPARFVLPPVPALDGQSQGDSGGPLTVEEGGVHTLVGVVSHGESGDTTACGQVTGDRGSFCPDSLTGGEVRGLHGGGQVPPLDQLHHPGQRRAGLL